MKDEPSNIERILTEMPLAEPSGALDKRVLAPTIRTGRRRIFWAGAAGLAAAAAVALAFLWPREHEQPATPTPPPVAVTQSERPHEPSRLDCEVVEMVPEGVVVPEDDNVPYRVFRRRATRHVWWENKDEGYEVLESIPRQDIIFVRAEVY